MSDFTVERLPIADLIAHKRNARHHPERQLVALEKRFRALGWYKNVVVARWLGTLTILAGHGIILGAQRAGETHAPCHVREIDPQSPEAIDILEGDNTTAEFSEDDQTQRLANLLTVQEAGRLENTGYDDAMLREALGALDEHEWQAPTEPQEMTKADLETKWFVGFVITAADKPRLTDLLEREASNGEKPHETLSRLVCERILTREQR